MARALLEGFVPAAGMPTLHEMEGGMGVSGAAGVGWPDLLLGGRRWRPQNPFLRAQRATSSGAAKVKSSAPWPPPGSGPPDLGRNGGGDRKAQDGTEHTTGVASRF